MTTTIHLRGLVKQFGADAETRPAVDGIDLDEHVLEVQIAMDEHRFSRLQRSLGDGSAGLHHPAGQRPARHQPATFTVELLLDLRQRRGVPRSQWGVVQIA